MKQFSYGERDYAFGQAMLTMRTAIGLTQAGLAELLGVSRNAVSRWEAGETYPKAEHLKALLAWSPTGALLLSGCSDGSVRWWDVQRGECLALRRGHQGAVQSLMQGESRWEDAGHLNCRLTTHIHDFRITSIATTSTLPH